MKNHFYIYMKKSYFIQINDIGDCHKYCDFVSRFRFEGYIKSKQDRIDKDDILRIFECCKKEIQLIVLDGEGRDILLMEEYLKHMGLLIS